MLLNDTQRAPTWKLAIYGPPGVGKTHLGMTAPDPLFLLFERQGFETVRTAARLLGRPMPPVFWVQDLDQFRRIRTILAKEGTAPIAKMVQDALVVPEPDDGDLLDRDALVKALPYVKPKTLVIDSLTEALEMVAAEVDKQGGQDTDKSGLTYRKLKAWNVIGDKGWRLIRAFRDLPYHAMFLCLEGERNHGSDDDPDTHYAPLLPGRQLPKMLARSVNVLGHLVLRRGRENDRMVVKRFVEFVADDTVATKTAYPLRRREPADVGAWLRTLADEKVSTETPEQVAGEPNTENDDETNEKEIDDA
jgi:hypothetical protein